MPRNGKEVSAFIKNVFSAKLRHLSLFLFLSLSFKFVIHVLSIRSFSSFFFSFSFFFLLEVLVSNISCTYIYIWMNE
jgi:hypothetical protein